MPLLVLASGFLCGIVLADRMAPPPPLLAALAAAACCLALALRRSRTDLLVCLGCAALLLGVLRHDAHIAELNAAPLLALRDGAAALTGMVAEEPERRATHQRLIVEVREAQQGRERRAVGGRMLVTLPLLPERRFGDLLTLRGRLETPANFSPDFDYREFLYRKGILAVMAFPSARQQAAGQGARWKATLIRVRQSLGAALERRLPEPQGALVKGMLLGTRADIPEEITAAFRATGTTHVLAISGQNLSIAAGLAVLLGRRLLGRRHPLFIALALGSIWGYALLVGLPVSVLRAAVMATLMVGAALVGRQNSGLPALLGTAALMAALDPLSPWDLGYQLSFLAMGGILFVAPLLEAGLWRLLRVRREERRGAGAALAGLAVTGAAGIAGATLATLPVALLNFTSHALLALPTTLFAVPALPAVLLAGGAAAVSGALADGAAGAPPLAALLNLLAGLGASGAMLASSALIFVVQVGAAAPLASVGLARAPEGAVWLYGAGLAGLVAGVHQRFGRQLRAAERPPSWSPQRAGLRPQEVWGLAGAAALAAGLALGQPGWAMGDGRLHLWALDLPKGDAALIRTPGGAKLLVDGGPDPGALARQLSRILPFWDRELPWLVLTAPQHDRLAGLREALARYRVQTVVEGPAAGAGAEYQEWEKLLAERGVRRIRLDQGSRLEIEPGSILEVLAAPGPPRPGRGGRAGSLALRLSTPSGDLILLGDPEDQVIDDLREDAAAQAGRTVKLHQRGDGPAWPASLLAALAPAMLVVSGDGAPGPAETPHYATGRHGTVEAVLEPGGGWVSIAR